MYRYTVQYIIYYVSTVLVLDRYDKWVELGKFLVNNGSLHSAHIGGSSPLEVIRGNKGVRCAVRKL